MKKFIILLILLIGSALEATTSLYLQSTNASFTSCSSSTVSFTFQASGGTPTAGKYTYTFTRYIGVNPDSTTTLTSASPVTFTINGAVDDIWSLTIQDSVTTLSLGRFLTPNHSNGRTSYSNFQYSITPPSGCGGLSTFTYSTVGSSTTSSATARIQQGSTAIYTNTQTGTTFPTQSTSLAAGIYTLNLVDNRSCFNSLATAITVPVVIPTVDSDLQISNVVPQSPLCFGDTGSVTFTLAGGSGSYSSVCAVSNTTAEQFCLTPPNVGTGSQTINDLPADTYTIYITDTDGCTAQSSEFVINEASSQITITTISPTSPSCAGESGSVTFDLAGGTGSYTSVCAASTTTSAEFCVTPPDVGTGSQTINDLPADTYTINVTDTNGCSQQSSEFTIDEAPSQITITTVTPTSPTCAGESGSVSFDLAGGTGSYTSVCAASTTTSAEFCITPPDVGTGSQTINDLPSDTYTINVTDTNGCTQQSSEFTINPAPSQVTISNITPSNPPCSGQSGSVTFDLAGGTGSYTSVCAASTTSSNQYCLSNVEAGSHTITDLPSDTYTIDATDSNGCTEQSAQFTINPAPSQVTISNIAPTSPICSGQSGSVTFSLAGGTGLYTSVCAIPTAGTPVCLTNVATGSQSINGLAAATYEIDVTDSNECTAQSSQFTINPAPSAVSITVNGTLAPTCYHGNNGAISFTASGGSGQYTSACLAPIPVGTPVCITTPFNAGSQQTINGLSAGSYTLTVTDSAGCTGSPPGTITVPSAGQILINYTSTPSSGGNDGAITFSITNGTAPYTAELLQGMTVLQTITGITEGAQEVFSNLAAGTYSIEVTDANECTESTPSIVVASSTQIIISNLTANPPACYGGKGSISFTVSGGTAPYNACARSITNDRNGFNCNRGFPADTTATINDLPSGTYKLTVTDSSNPSNSTTTTVIVPQTAPLTFTTLKTRDDSCRKSRRYKLTIKAKGGTGPYQYSIDDGQYQSSKTFSCVPKGCHKVTVQDAHGCISCQCIKL